MGASGQIVLDFYLAATGWSFSERELLSLTEMNLSYGSFEGDVIFRIGSCDFSMNAVALIDFAAQMLRVRDEMPAVDAECMFDFTEGQGELTFKRAGSDVKVSASYVDCEARVAFEDLTKEIDAFVQRIISTIRERSPLLLENISLCKMLRISSR